MLIHHITPEWINLIVARDGRSRLAPCVEIHIEPIPNERVQVHRLSLRYTDGSGERPATLILKTPVGPPLPGGGPSSHDAGAREAYFFRHLADASEGWTSRCFAVDTDPDSGTSVLLLEDLSARGMRQGNRVAGIRRGEAEAVFRRLASFHASQWNQTASPAQREVRELSERVSTASDAAVREYYRAAWPAVETCGIYAQPPEVARYGRALMDDPARSQRHLARRPQTILHGDVHTENIFFDDASEALGFALIDWEDLTVGNALVDVAWLMTTSVHTQDVTWEPDLLRNYYDALRACGVLDYSWDDCLSDYRWAIANVFVQGVLNSSVEATAPAHEVEVERELGQRFILACQRSRLWDLDD